MQAARQALGPVTQRAIDLKRGASRVACCPQGSTGAAWYAAPLLASRVGGSHRRGALDLWMLGTVGVSGYGLASIQPGLELAHHRQDLFECRHITIKHLAPHAFVIGLPGRSVSVRWHEP
jgi:hypothetical protein